MPQVEIDHGCVPYIGCQPADAPVQASWTAPAPRGAEKKPVFTPCRITVCEVPQSACGKVADAEGPCKMLEVCSGDNKTTCEKMTLTQKDCCPVTVTVQEGKVHVQDMLFEATADSVSQDTPGSLKLTGNVKVRKCGGTTQVDAHAVQLSLTPVSTFYWQMGWFR